MEDLRTRKTETILEKELAKSELPDIAKERIRKLYTGKIAKVEEITESIKSEKEYIAKIAENKQVNVGNSGKDSEVKEQNKEKYEAKLKEVYEAMGYSEKEVEDLLKIKRGKSMATNMIIKMAMAEILPMSLNSGDPFVVGQTPAVALVDEDSDG